MKRHGRQRRRPGESSAAAALTRGNCAVRTRLCGPGWFDSCENPFGRKSVGVVRGSLMKKIIWIIASIALALFGAGQYVKWTNSDLTELARIRRAALAEIRPALLRYKLETGSFPQRLELMVPGYLPQVPPVLQNAADAEPARRIRYESRGEAARFSYHVIRGPDSIEVFDVGGNSFERNR